MHLKTYIPTLLTCLVVAGVTAPVHAGLFLILVIPIVVIWALVNLFFAWRRTEGRRVRLVRIGVWATCLCALLSTHWYYRHAARHAGQLAANAIGAYKSAHGSYPLNMAAVGLSRNSRWRINYVLAASGPFLMYPSTFV